MVAEKKTYVCEYANGKIVVREDPVDYSFTVVKRFTNGIFALKNYTEYFSFATSKEKAVRCFSIGIQSVFDKLQDQLKEIEKLNKAIKKTEKQYLERNASDR